MTANPSSAPQSTSASAGKLQNMDSKRSIAAATVGGTKSFLRATAGMPVRFKGSFDYQFVRTMGCVAYDRVAIGECYEPGSRIAQENAESDSESWCVTARRGFRRHDIHT
jgi:hypothetical protein